MSGRTVLAGCLAAACLVVAGCGAAGTEESGGGQAAATSGGDYTIVSVSELSGALAANNGPNAYGAQAYFDMVNRDGGVNGRKINYVSLDGQTDTSATVAATRKALQMNPMAVLMGGLTSEVQAAAPLVTSQKIPMIAISGTPDEWYYPTSTPFAYQTSVTGVATANAQAGLMLHLAEKDGIARPKVAIVALVSPYGDSLIAQAKKIAPEKGFEIVAEVRNAVGDTSFSANAAKIARAKPDYIFGQEVQGIVPAVLTSLRAVGVDQPFINFSLSDSPDLFERFKDPNYYVMRFANFPTDPALTEMAAAAKASGVEEHMTTAFFVLGWNGAAIVVDALKRCGEDCTPELLNDQIQNTNIDLTPVTFGPTVITPDRHYAASIQQAFHWTEQGVVPEGEPIDGSEG